MGFARRAIGGKLNPDLPLAEASAKAAPMYLHGAFA
jgi:hypothetical protein